MSKVKVVVKKGLINEEGKIIVPPEYESVQVLKCGVYIAKVSTLNTDDEEPIRSQHYHHRKLTPVKDISEYHLYTDKGKVQYAEPIMYYICDAEDHDKVIEIKGAVNGWRYVELDYENNIFRVIE